MNCFRLHRVQFCKFEPKAIQCLSYNESSFRLAVGRADCNIEVWNLEHTPWQECIIPCHIENSVEAITWCCSRLFSAGLNAYVTEYDLIKLAPKYSFPVASGPTWCIAANKQETTIAVGTENGYISLFSLNDDSVSPLFTFTKQEGRIICLAWHPSGETIVSGSINRINIWSVKTGTTVDSISVGSMERKAETIVWCVAITSDFTIISGDSWGKTSFWDGKTTTLLQTLKSHKADVLSLCISKDEETVYVSGVDPVIVAFGKVQTHSSGRQQWLKSTQRRLHTHDVKALTIAGNYLVSGGIDTYLSLSKYPPKTYLKYPPLSQRHDVQIAKKACCLLCKYPQALEIWKLGTTKVTKGNDGDILPLDSDAKKLLRLDVKKQERIVSCAISDDGQWLAYSTTENLRLYYFSFDDSDSSYSHPTLEKIRSLPKECNCGAHMLAFASAGKHLVIVTPSQSIHVLRVNLTQPVLEHTLPYFSKTISRYCLLCLNRDGSLAACGDITGNIVIYNILEGKIHCKLPWHKSQPTAIAFHPATNNLLVVYSDLKFVEYCPEKSSYTQWSREQPPLDDIGASLHYPITGVTFDVRDSDIILLHNDAEILLIDKKQATDKKTSKRVKADCKTTLTKSRPFKHIAFCQSLGEDQLVLVEITPDEIMNSLPPALSQKKFGT